MASTPASTSASTSTGALPTPVSESKQWARLQAHAAEQVAAPGNYSLRALFAQDPERAGRLSLTVDLSGEEKEGESGPEAAKVDGVETLFLDYSKNRVTDDTLEMLRDLLLHASPFESLREAMFAGDADLNCTEHRAVLHVALRDRSPDASVRVGGVGEDVMPEVHSVLGRMRAFTEKVRSGAWKGHSGKSIEAVVNLGIGGSDLGPLMVVEALKP
jgi:glucose-6-phosphate isomerase